ncbi:GNAT family N-acetyltransferase [Ekhidna sp.]|uniref:GNAT family N-acetyltransferase n=1 Tax=Ekhidna sp. TaxID=2608089 RepID=UPI003298574F
MTSAVILKKIDKRALADAYDFLESVFSREQHIPKELIPLKSKDQHWWCAKKNDVIVGTVAAWNEQGDWHWGRLAVDPNQRGLGLGKMLALHSFKDLFALGIQEIMIDARDITVGLLESLGGKVTGSTVEFYGFPITPMKLKKDDFIKSISG